MYPDIRSPDYLPVRTIVKFYTNHLARRSARNKLISKSLLKTVLIDETWLDGEPKVVPADGEFWLVDLVHETCAGEPRGAFLCHPIRKVEFDQVNRLLPGMFEERWHGADGQKSLLMLEPKVGGVNWMLPLRHRNRIKDVYAVVVSQ